MSDVPTARPSAGSAVGTIYNSLAHRGIYPIISFTIRPYETRTSERTTVSIINGLRLAVKKSPRELAAAVVVVVLTSRTAPRLSPAQMTRNQLARKHPASPLFGAVEKQTILPRIGVIIPSRRRRLPSRCTPWRRVHRSFLPAQTLTSTS